MIAQGPKANFYNQKSVEADLKREKLLHEI